MIALVMSQVQRHSRLDQPLNLSSDQGGEQLNLASFSKVVPLRFGPDPMTKTRRIWIQSTRLSSVGLPSFTSVPLYLECSAMNAAHESELAENELHCLRRDRERYPATDGFKWSSEKKVKLNSIAVAKGQKVLEKIASETEKIESPFELISTPAQRSRPMETPFASQVRPPLGDVTNSGFRSSSSLYAADGKRKAEDISFSPSNLSPSFARGNRASMASAQVTPLVRRSTGRLGSSARRPLLQPGSPVASSSTPSKPPTNAAAGPRISLGMTPGRLHSGNVPRFTTPFKDPSRVGVASTSKEKIPDRMLLSSRGISAPSVMKVDHITRATKQVFNLDKTGLERLSLDDMFDPESTYLNQTTSRLTLDDCDTIRQILNKPSKGRQYAFAVEGKLCGFGSAHVMIQDAADMTVPRAWVENHYTQILWKLAAYTRHVLDDRYWNWNEVCRQIKYRYEREVNQKQRPALMQIMRRGRMPNRGIVLCVMEIPQFKLGPDAEQVLVLTDGWYKIKARLDGVLSMAVYGRDAEEEHRLAVNAKIRGEQTEQNQVEVLTNKIRIKVGSKLCIQGCGYESELETVEPIKGFESCRLLLGGNQVKLARWDAKLGFAGAPFISTIRSLSAGGGSIGLMDLVVTRIYPVAFSGAETCPDYRNTEVTEWGFEEEEERRKVWERHRARTKKEIIKEQEEEIAVYKRIYEQLDQACEGLSNGSYDDGECYSSD